MKWITKEQVSAEAAKSDEAALEVSILHWEQLCKATKEELKTAVNEKKVNVGDNFCGLCQRFSHCQHCPLRPERLTASTCCPTWHRASAAFVNWHYQIITKRQHQTFVTKARIMLAKLKSLRN